MTLDRGTHRVFALGDHWTVDGHFCVQCGVVSPFGWQIVLMENGRWRTFGNASFAIDAFFWMNEEHRFAFVETLYGANGHTIGVLAVKAGFCHHVCHRELTFAEKKAWPD